MARAAQNRVRSRGRRCPMLILADVMMNVIMYSMLLLTLLGSHSRFPDRTHAPPPPPLHRRSQTDGQSIPHTSSGHGTSPRAGRWGKRFCSCLAGQLVSRPPVLTAQEWRQGHLRLQCSKGQRGDLVHVSQGEARLGTLTKLYSLRESVSKAVCKNDTIYLAPRTKILLANLCVTCGRCTFQGLRQS